jgi:hypothetical protein
VSVPGLSPSSMAKRRKRGYAHFFRAGKIEVDHETGCWIWLGSQFPDGYGKIQDWNGQFWIPIRAQAYFWKLYRGKAEGMDVGHNCHRRLCVRLRHLKPKTHTMNMRDMFAFSLGEAERSEVKRLMLEGFDYAYIAEKLMAPRPLIMKEVKAINWRQDELFG